MSRNERITNKTHLVYFSPTNTTEHVINFMFEIESLESIAASHNLTDIQYSGIQMNFASDDMVVFGTPVYSGRVPKTAIDRFHNLKGRDTPAVLIVTYGNRNYDDALIELADLVTAQGFRVVAASAVVAEHSVVRKIAEGRPNETDKKLLRSFASEVLKKDFSKDLNISRLGNRPYRKYQSIPFVPKGDNNCVSCGICVKSCPTNAIKKNEPKHTDKKRCVSCMRCVKLCPQKARNFSNIEQYISYKFISKKCNDEKKSVLFI